MFSRNDRSVDLVQGYWRVADWGMTVSELSRFIQQHVELGVDVCDHADIYGDYRCEALFGDALRYDASLRAKVRVVSKCDIKLTSNTYPDRKINHYDTSAEHIMASVDNSLQRLGVERLDCLLLHRPDFLLDPFEVADCFDHLLSAGKVKEFGVSNFNVHQFDLLQSACASLPLVTNQVECNALRFECLEDGSVDRLHGLKRRPMAWSPMAGGELFNPGDESAKRVVEALRELSVEYGASLAQLAVAWISKHPAQFSIVAGTSNISRLKELQSGYDLNMSREDWYRVWVASKGHGVP